MKRYFLVSCILLLLAYILYSSQSISVSSSTIPDKTTISPECSIYVNNILEKMNE